MSNLSIREKMRQDNAKYAAEKKAENQKNKQILDKRKEFQNGFNQAIDERKKYIKKKYEKGQYFTKYNRPDKDDFLDINSGEIMVETAGYIPLADQIRRFERAGVSLEEQMMKLYDFSPIDLNDDGFKDANIMQYPTKIEAFEILQNNQINALKQILNADQEENNDVNMVPSETETEINENIPENNKTEEPKTQGDQKS